MSAEALAVVLPPVQDGRVARRVLVVDDHQGFREAARRLLDAPGYEVVGEAETGEEAVEAARWLRPDVVLLDVQLPGIDGFAVAELLAQAESPPVVVLVSNRPRSAYRRRLQGAPAAGFISKPELTLASVEALVA